MSSMQQTAFRRVNSRASGLRLREACAVIEEKCNRIEALEKLLERADRMVPATETEWRADMYSVLMNLDTKATP